MPMSMIKKFLFLFQNKNKDVICCGNVKLQKYIYPILCLFILMFAFGCKEKNGSSSINEKNEKVAPIQDVELNLPDETVKEDEPKQLKEVQTPPPVMNEPSIFDDFWGSFPDTLDVNEVNVFGNIEVKDASDEKDSYAFRSGYEAVVNVYGKYGSVEYWEKGEILKFQILSLEKETDLHPLSSFIGKDYESVLNAYPDSIYELNEHELSYNSTNYEFFITFDLSDGIITEIVLGRNL